MAVAAERIQVLCPGALPVPASTHPHCGKCLTQIQASLARQVPREKQVLDAASDHE